MPLIKLIQRKHVIPPLHTHTFSEIPPPLTHTHTHTRHTNSHTYFNHLTCLHTCLLSLTLSLPLSLFLSHFSVAQTLTDAINHTCAQTPSHTKAKRCLSRLALSLLPDQRHPFRSPSLHGQALRSSCTGRGKGISLLSLPRSLIIKKKCAHGNRRIRLFKWS